MAGPVHIIQTVVAEEFGITREELLSPSRRNRFAHPRMIAVQLARELTKAGYSTIARKFSRHHTSILSAIRRVPDLLQAYPEYGIKRQAVLARLQS